MTRVRFAPAPTGFLHIGGARTYIFSRLFARKAGGQVVLRIDDTDIERSTGELTGQPVGPNAFANFGVPGKERVIERLRRV